MCTYIPLFVSLFYFQLLVLFILLKVLQLIDVKIKVQ